MSKPFDATLNSLVDAHPVDWADFLVVRVGLPPGPAEPLDTDLSATLQADRLFRHPGPPACALHLELEGTGRLGVPAELLRYNVAAFGATGLPVHSVLMLLRPKANASDLTGTFALPGADGTPYLTFRYTVVRVWQESVDGLLAGGVGLAPLALLTNEAAADLPAAFGRIDRRLRQPDVPGNVRQAVLGWTNVLGGMRYTEAQIEELYMGLHNILEESTTYQKIIRTGRAEGKAEGRAEGELDALRATILRLATKRFGPPPAGADAAVRAVTDPARLERLTDRVLDATGWDDLLATP